MPPRFCPILAAYQAQPISYIWRRVWRGEVTDAGTTREAKGRRSEGPARAGLGGKGWGLGTLGRGKKAETSETSADQRLRCPSSYPSGTITRRPWGTRQ